MRTRMLFYNRRLGDFGSICPLFINSARHWASSSPIVAMDTKKKIHLLDSLTSGSHAYLQHVLDLLNRPTTPALRLKETGEDGCNERRVAGEIPCLSLQAEDVSLALGGVKRVSTFKHFEKNDTKSPRIDLSRVIGLLAEQLGCHIRRRANIIRRSLHRVGKGNWKSEINNDRVFGDRIEKNVIRLEVAVSNSLIVHMNGSFDELSEDGESFVLRNRARFLKNSIECRVWKVFHDNVTKVVSIN